MDFMKYVQGQHRGIRWFFENTVISGTAPEKFKERVNNHGNSIAWLMWHTARTEDFTVNAIIRQRPQIVEDGWAAKLGVDELRIGTGFNDDEVEDLTKDLDVSALDEYWKTVADDTSLWLGSNTEDVLNERFEAEERFATVPQPFSPGQGAMVLWQGRSAGFLLSTVVITHAYIHLGEMNAIRGQIGAGGYW